MKSHTNVRITTTPVGYFEVGVLPPGSMVILKEVVTKKDHVMIEMTLNGSPYFRPVSRDRLREPTQEEYDLMKVLFERV